jgi:acyl-CoA thioester hydrolase
VPRLKQPENAFSLHLQFLFYTIACSAKGQFVLPDRGFNMKDVPDRLGGYAVVVDAPVNWYEMDAFGHVNNMVYFRYFEMARIAYYEMLDVPEFIGRDPVGPILAETSCRFRAPLVYPDKISIGARVKAVGDDRFTFGHAVFSHKLQRIAAEGEALTVCYDYRQERKAPVPHRVRQRIAEIEKNAGIR